MKPAASFSRALDTLAIPINRGQLVIEHISGGDYRLYVLVHGDGRDVPDKYAHITPISGNDLVALSEYLATAVRS